MAFMYILQCRDGSYYTGSTKKDVHVRVMEHNTRQGCEYTVKRLPAKLVYFEQFGFVRDAYEREQQIKGWSRKKKEALIKGDIKELIRLANCKKEDK